MASAHQSLLALPWTPNWAVDRDVHKGSVVGSTGWLRLAASGSAITHGDQWLGMRCLISRLFHGTAREAQISDRMSHCHIRILGSTPSFTWTQFVGMRLHSVRTQHNAFHECLPYPTAGRQWSPDLSGSLCEAINIGSSKEHIVRTPDNECSETKVLWYPMLTNSHASPITALLHLNIHLL